MVSKKALTGTWLAGQEHSGDLGESAKARLECHQGSLCPGVLPASLCTSPYSSLMAASPLKMEIMVTSPPEFYFLPLLPFLSQLGSSQGKIERPGLDPVPTPDQSAEARGVVGSKNMVPSRLMGGPQWRWCKKHGPIVRRPGTGSLEPLPIWGHVHWV